MACTVLLEVFVLIVHDIFCAVPTFLVQDIGSSKSQFLQLNVHWRVSQDKSFDNFLSALSVDGIYQLWWDSHERPLTSSFRFVFAILKFHGNCSRWKWASTSVFNAWGSIDFMIKKNCCKRKHSLDNRQNSIFYNYSAPYGLHFMACSVVLEVFVVIVHDVFCAVPTFSVKDIGNLKSQFLHLPISLGGAMLQVRVYGLGQYISLTPTYWHKIVVLGKIVDELFNKNCFLTPSFANKHRPLWRNVTKFSTHKKKAV